jgi:hypothetical protein
MQKYLKDMVEWAAHKILARAVTRAAEMIDQFDEAYEAQPRCLVPPKLPQIEYRIEH